MVFMLQPILWNWEMLIWRIRVHETSMSLPRTRLARDIAAKEKMIFSFCRKKRQDSVNFATFKRNYVTIELPQDVYLYRIYVWTIFKVSLIFNSAFKETFAY